MKSPLVRAAAVLAAVAALLGAVAAWRWWTSDARRIQGAMDRLLASVEKSGAETQLDRLGHARDFADAFARPFHVRATPYAGTIDEARELMAIVDGYRANATTIRARATDRELEVRENGTADLFAVIDLDSALLRGSGRERFRARLSWVKADGEWKVSEAEVLERLETSGLF